MSNQRKHVTQMTNAEVDSVSALIRSIRDWDGNDSPHLKERKRHWNVTDAEVQSAIHNGTLIEVHRNNFPDVRAVLRHDVGMRSVNVTISLVQHTVITVWINAIDDRHSTLKIAEYAWGGSLIPVLSTLRGAEAR